MMSMEEEDYSSSESIIQKGVDKNNKDLDDALCYIQANGVNEILSLNRYYEITKIDDLKKSILKMPKNYSAEELEYAQYLKIKIDSNEPITKTFKNYLEDISF